MCHPAAVARNGVSLLPKLREQFVEFLHSHSLKRLGILYQSTCVGLRYGPYVGAISWKYFVAPINPIRRNNYHPSSHTHGLRNINLITIPYACRPRVRLRLTLRGLTLRRKP